MKQHRIAALSLVMIFIVCLCGCAKKTEPDYADGANWAYLETEVAGKAVDVFFVCPTVYSGTEEQHNMALADEKTKENFCGAINMEKGIYDADSRFFAPYYRQASLNAYLLPPAEREPYLATAYADVKSAFLYYMAHYNQGRPILLAGFSQGADLCLRLLKDCFRDEATNCLLVACYAIGWHISEEELTANPHLKFAAGENDTGVIVSFNSEAEGIDTSLVVASDEKTLAINPLNWKTDSTPAEKSQNHGACFTDYSGNIQSEIPQLTGAYIDSSRGTLKVPDVLPEDYAVLPELFEPGVYHVYDYQFFYRNLQENVGKRLAAYLH